MTDHTQVSFDALQGLRSQELEKSMNVATAVYPTIAGIFDKNIFIASKEATGKVLVTLATPGNAPPRHREVRRFFRHWGLEPLRELSPKEVASPSIRTFVVCDGVETVEA